MDSGNSFQIFFIFIFIFIRVADFAFAGRVLMMKFLGLVGLLGLLNIWGFSIAAVAQDGGQTPSLVRYSCHVMILSKDLENGSAEFNYEVTLNGESASSNGPHGGAEYPFAAKNHKLSVMSNARWLGMGWWKNDEQIAQALTVRADDNKNSQVIILYNPKDVEEQASIDCTLKAI
jgi:hypothetical protein